MVTTSNPTSNDRRHSPLAAINYIQKTILLHPKKIVFPYKKCHHDCRCRTARRFQTRSLL